MTIYYIPPYDGRTTVTAFAPVRIFLGIRTSGNAGANGLQGFRMLVGDADLRQAEGQQRQLCHRCFTTVEQNPFGGAPCVDGTGMDTAALPNKACPGGIRATITFPT